MINSKFILLNILFEEGDIIAENVCELLNEDYEEQLNYGKIVIRINDIKCFYDYKDGVMIENDDDEEFFAKDYSTESLLKLIESKQE